VYTLAKKLKVENNMGMRELLKLPNVLKLKEKRGGLAWEEVEPVLKKAIDLLKKSRAKEGQNLAGDILERIKFISENVTQIGKLDKGRIGSYKKKIEDRLNKLLDSSSIDSERLEKEIAIYSDRIDITEELIRIKSHIKEFKKQIKKSGAIGKSLDFRLQELMREFNTISNKCNNVDISNCSVACRGELEKIREQVQNIE
jgi:uncharacterized protein (TIGR00255 family)